MEDFSQYDLYPNGFSRMIVPHRREVASRRRPGKRRCRPEVHDEGSGHGSRGSSAELRAKCARPCRHRKRARAQAARAHSLREVHRCAADRQLGHRAISPTCRSACIRKACSSCASCRMRRIPRRFYYDNMTMFRYVDDPGYTVPGWMGLPPGIDVTRRTRPNVTTCRRDEKPNLGEVLDQDVGAGAQRTEGHRDRAVSAVRCGVSRNSGCGISTPSSTGTWPAQK